MRVGRPVNVRVGTRAVIKRREGKMPRLSIKFRVLICVAISALLIVGMTSFAFSQPILPIPGTDIDLGDLLPLGDDGLLDLVDDVTDTLTNTLNQTPLPLVPQVTGTVNNLVDTVTGNVENTVQSLPVKDIPVVNTVVPVLTGAPTKAAAATNSGVTGTSQLTGALTSVPGADALSSLSPASLPGLDTLTGLLDPANLESIPLLGSLLGLLNPTNLPLPTLGEIPVVSSLVPVLTGLLDKLEEIPVVGPILTPIIEIIKKILGILNPTPEPEEPEIPEIPSTPMTPTVPGVVTPEIPAAVGESPGGTLPFTGADFTGIIFLIVALLGSTLLVRKLEVSLRKG